jgi:hypothetical protein
MPSLVSNLIPALFSVYLVSLTSIHTFTFLLCPWLLALPLSFISRTQITHKWWASNGKISPKRYEPLPFDVNALCWTTVKLH